MKKSLFDEKHDISEENWRKKGGGQPESEIFTFVLTTSLAMEEIFESVFEYQWGSFLLKESLHPFSLYCDIF